MRMGFSLWEYECGACTSIRCKTLPKGKGEKVRKLTVFYFTPRVNGIF